MARVVDGAVRRARLGVDAQAVCLALAAFGGVLALALVEGARLADPGAHCAALVAAVAVGGAWRGVRPVAAVSVTRTADARLGFEGLFVAAWEEEHRAPGGPVAALLARRVLRASRPVELRRAGEPESLPFLAAPLAAAVALAVTAAFQAERDAALGGAFQLAALAAEELAAAARARDLGTELGPAAAAEVAAALAAASAEAAAVQATLRAEGGSAGGGRLPGSGAEPGKGAAAERAAALAERLDALGAALARAKPDVQQRVARAAAALDAVGLEAGGSQKAQPAAQGGADGGPQPGSAAQPEAPPLGPGPAAGGAPAPAGAPLGPGAAAPPVTEEGAHVTLAGSPVGGEAPGAGDDSGVPPAAVDPSTVEGGTAGGAGAARAPEAGPAPAAPRAWPARYDDLADRWLRARAPQRP